MQIHSQKLIWWLLLGLAALNFLAWSAVFQLTPANQLEVYFFDIGQGDSTLLQLNRTRQILIDGGPDNKVAEKLGQVMPFWDHRLDLVILSHPHKDHLSGLLDVLQRYKVANVLWTGVQGEGYIFERWLARLDLEQARRLIATDKLRLELGQLKLRVLFPLASLENQQLSNLNNSSVVLRAEFGRFSLLLTGDAEKPLENSLLASGKELTSHVLKVGHQGSRTSSQQSFLEQVKPELAVISVGANSYGHPHQEVLDRLQALGINILRTDQQGDIKLITDGQQFKLF